MDARFIPRTGETWPIPTGNRQLTTDRWRFHPEIEKKLAKAQTKTKNLRFQAEFGNKMKTTYYYCILPFIKRELAEIRR